MNTRLTLAVSLAVSMTSAYSAETIKIKDMYLGMTVDNAVIALSNALSVPASEMIVVKLDGGRTCIFTPGLKAELDKEPGSDKALCGITHGSPEAILAMIQQDFVRTFTAALKSKELPLSQLSPLATFTNNAMVTMTFQDSIVEKIFSYGRTDFKTFANGFITAYGIPTLNRVKCTFEQSKFCWDYNDGNGTLVSMLGDDNTSPPIIQMFKVSTPKF